MNYGVPSLASENTASRAVLARCLFSRGVTGAQMTTYFEKLQDPRWQKRRLQILEASGWKCDNCESETKTLHVHHKIYRKGWAPWEYDDCDLQALCKDCHASVSELHKQIDESFALMNDYDLERVLGYCHAILLFGGMMEPGQEIEIKNIIYAEGVSDVVGARPLGAYEVIEFREDRKLSAHDIIAIWDRRRTKTKEL
jgi:hypothetical protein